jgi:hypothetical protein
MWEGTLINRGDKPTKTTVKGKATSKAKTVRIK